MVARRLQWDLLVPVLALLYLAFRSTSVSAPTAASEGELRWRLLHESGARGRGPNGLGAILQDSYVAGDTIVAVGSGQILRSTDNGDTWHYPELPRGGGLDIAATSADSDTILVSQLGGRIQRSTDRGRTWSTISTPSEVSLVSVGIGEYGAVAVGNRTLLYSRDGGASWREVPAPRVSFADVAVRGSNVLVCGGAGGLMQSIDGGRTWRFSWLNTRQIVNSIAFANDTTVVMVGSNGTILRSTNAGVTWDEIPSPTRQSLRSVAFESEMHGLAVGLWGEAIRTADAGATWRRERTGTDVHLLSVTPAQKGGFLVTAMRETMFRVTATDRE